MLEMLRVLENESFRSANRMATGEPLAWYNILQVAFNMVHHFVNSGVIPRPVVISASIISDAYDTLGLRADEGERIFNKRLLLR
jgi:hypothetical protein